jgi:long-chain acyl-CoA synthetase
MPTPDTLPWLRFYGRTPATLEYPEVTLYEALAATARRAPDAIAWEFLGTRGTFRALLEDIDRCAAGFERLGLKAGDRILISMPTSPQGVVAFYAANRLGAAAAMVHPLSTAPEITQYLDATGARIAVVLDAFYATMAATTPKIPLEAIVVARIPDVLPPLLRFGFWLTKGRKIAPVPAEPRVHRWTALMAPASAPSAPPAGTPDHEAAILFSGGTTGQPKGIVLSNRNFVSESMQVASWAGMEKNDAMLAILPLFHGFGLGVCVNAVLMAGGTSILVPVFTAEDVAKLLKKRRPSLLVGVPTLYDSLAKDPVLQTADLSSLRACFSGADTLPRPVKERFETLVRERGGRVQLLEGYGLTEAVSAMMATPLGHYREGSIGIPFPDMLAIICAPGTEEELAVGTEGEICISGPAVMKGYLDDPEATALALRRHADGRIWLHTGDLGKRDADGFFYFTGRLKRMIKSSGFNVYPSQVETVLYQHPKVMDACVVGVPDEAQVERVKAYVVLRDAAGESKDTEAELIAFCRERLIKWSCPREIEFRRDLPKTRIGKIDYRTLVEDHIAKAAGRKQETE